MELTIDRASLVAGLRAHLEEMERCAAELEEILLQEEDAVRRFDGAALLDLCGMRAACRDRMARLEGSLRRLLGDHGVAGALPLSRLLDEVAADEELKALRRRLHRRMEALQQRLDEERLRIKAAADVTTNLLQGIGMLRKPQTYRRDGIAP
ncbi:MAG: hypothetical protein D6682_05150 [Zetaproteobacteria bacterium]|nr:MAG: hypothetical protein D6682_05150 [Zetaproteobacteria bacterium]